MKKFKKVVNILMVMIMFISLFQNIVMATMPISKANLKSDHTINTNVEFLDGTQWAELEAEYICYTTNGKKYPAYCISHRT